jgi:hypothetical protein
MTCHRYLRFFALALAASLAAGCAARSTPPREQWMPVPAYHPGLDASVGTICGHREEAPTGSAIVVDILIDSLEGTEFNAVPLIVQPLPDWQKNRPKPVIGVTVIYPRPGAATMRESWSECGAREGATIRLNAATIGRAGVAISAADSVRVTVRAMDGRPLTSPIILAPTSSRVLLRWTSRSRAT